MKMINKLETLSTDLERELLCLLKGLKEIKKIFQIATVVKKEMKTRRREIFSRETLLMKENLRRVTFKDMIEYHN